MIHIGSDFPDEFKGSEDTKNVRGANAKAKANLVQGIRQMIGVLNLYDVINVKKETSSPFEL